jgi:hypothetical protein
MKKFLVLIAFIAISFSASAQLGVKFGLNFNSIKDVKIQNADATVSSRTGVNFGILYRWKLPLGFAIQPELLYTSKGGNVELKSKESSSLDEVDFKMNYLQVPLNLQFGADLVLLRPYVQVSPYIGYAFSKGSDLKEFKWENFNRCAYGIGLGGGLDIWKFQISGRYCWDLGTIGDFDLDDVPDQLKNLKDSKNKGFELSIALIF